MNEYYGWECSSCGAWGAGTKKAHFQDCDLLILRECLADISAVLLAGWIVIE